MKVAAYKIHLVLGLTLLTQVGCSGGQQQRAQFLTPTATTPMDQNVAGSAFSRNAQPGGNGWGNIMNTGGRIVAGGGGTIIPGGGGTTSGATTKETSTTKETTTTTQTTPTTFKVELPKEAPWKQPCLDLLEPNATLKRNDPLNKDTDGDGIPDRCEDVLSQSANEQFIGLDKAVFNGAMVAVKRFYKEDAGVFGSKKAPDGSEFSSILLTKAEHAVWKDSKKLRGGFGDGVDAKFDRQVVRKLLARGTIGGSDMAGLRDLISLKQSGQKGVPTADPYFTAFHDNQIAHRGIKNGLQDLEDKKQYALVRNDYFEMIPFPISREGSSVGALSGMQKDMVKSLREGDEFMYVAETHVVVPEGIELRVGNLMNDRTQALAGSKAGMFFVIHDNNTDIITTDLVHSNLTDAEVQASIGMISAPSNCMTVHFAIAYLADSKKVGDVVGANAMFAENVFYHDTKADSWKPIPQEWMRLKAMDLNSEQKCKVDEKDIIFQDAAEILSLATPGK